MASNGFLLRSVLVLALAASPSCLPADDRPPPGNVTFTVSPSPAVQDGVTTADGFRITFTRLLLDIGRTGLNDPCTEYAEARYDRLLDVTKGSGQKLSIIYGLGDCDVRFRIAAPTPDVLLGEGVTVEDKYFMGTYGTDAYARSTASVFVEGHAVQGDVDETFRWTFRKSIRYGSCRLPGDAGAPPVHLTGNVPIVKDIVIRGEALFRDEPRADAELRFAPFAAADRTFGNADGVVDLDELSAIRLPFAKRLAAVDGGGIGVPSAGAIDASTDATDASTDTTDAAVDVPYAVTEGGSFRSADGATETVETLRDYVYVILLPELPVLDGIEPCSVQGRQGFRE